MPNKEYFPRLSELISQQDLESEMPMALSFISTAISSLFDKLHYKDLVLEKSEKGESASYSFKLLTKDSISLNIGEGENQIALVLNSDSPYSSFPLSLNWRWEIMGIVKTMTASKGVLPSVDVVLELLQQVFNLSESAILAHAHNKLVKYDPDTYGSIFDQMIIEIDASHANNGSFAPSLGSEPLLSIANMIRSNVGGGLNKTVAAAIFQTYLIRKDGNGDIDELASWDEIKDFFKTLANQDVKEYLLDLVTPKVNATLTLAGSIQFPRKWFIPIDNSTGFPSSDPNELAEFTFGETTFYADSEKGMGLNSEFALSSTSPVSIVYPVKVMWNN